MTAPKNARGCLPSMAPVILLVLALLAGCVQKDAFRPKVPILSPETTATISAAIEARLEQFRQETQTSGPQTGRDRVIQVGTVKVDGLALAVVCCCAIGAGWLWKGQKFARRGIRHVRRRATMRRGIP